MALLCWILDILTPPIQTAWAVQCSHWLDVQCSILNVSNEWDSLCGHLPKAPSVLSTSNANCLLGEFWHQTALCIMYGPGKGYLLQLPPLTVACPLRTAYITTCLHIQTSASWWKSPVDIFSGSSLPRAKDCFRPLYGSPNYVNHTLFCLQYLYFFLVIEAPMTTHSAK